MLYSSLFSRVVYPPQNQYTKQFCAYHVYVKTLTRCAKKIRTSHYEDVKMWLEFLIEHVESETQCGDWYTQLAWLYMTKKPVNIQKVIALLPSIRKCFMKLILGD